MGIMTKPAAAPPRIKLDHRDLARFVADAFRAGGMRAEDAATVADVLVWGNLRGIESHGVARLPRYLEILEHGDMDAGARPAPRRLSPALFHLDAEKAAGPVAMMRAVAEALDMVKETGVCLGVVSRTTHAGAVGRYAQIIAEQGHAAIVIAAGLPNMAYHGTKAPSLSTSPIAIAVPSQRYGALLLDMATAIAAFGRINQARLAGQPIPPGWALSKDGSPTTDAAAADIMLPLGGPKGSGLALMFECLTGILPAAPILSRLVVGMSPKRPNAQNAMLIAIDIARFRPVPEFRRDVDELADILKGLPRSPDTEEVLMPGERGQRTEVARRQGGVPLPARLWQQFGEIATRLGLTLPTPLPL